MEKNLLLGNEFTQIYIQLAAVCSKGCNPKFTLLVTETSFELTIYAQTIMQIEILLF